MRTRILITGPGGRVGTQILPLLRESFTLRLFDRRPLQAEADDEIIVGDIRDLQQLKEACSGVHAMIHLAAIPEEADFASELLPMNLLGVHNAFEAARQAGVRRVIFASTGQTVLNYGKGVWINTDQPVRPSSVYGCTKIFGEALARYYSDRYDMSMICIRLCWFQPYDSPLLKSQPEMRSEWCSPRDFAQLLTKCIHAEISFAIFFGVSDNRDRYWDISNARLHVGYEPQDSA